MDSKHLFQYVIITLGGLFIGLIAYKNYSILPMRSQIKTAVLEVIQTGHKKTEYQMADEIWVKIRRMEDGITPNNITVKKTRVDAGHYLAEANVTFRPKVEFFFANIQVDLSVSEKVPLIEF